MRETSKHGPDIKCKRGCAACCHLSVDVSPQEAILLRVIAKDQGIPIDEARLDRQASKSFDTWHELPVEDRRCVFLGEDNACRVYEHRPGACRKYTVKSDPERCDMDKYPGGEVAIVFDVEAEIIQSAAMTVFGARSMAEQLIATREGPA
ncbi:MAG TPA: YkgJ family cysteine cluster protein [Burkholderiaceae bacterium]|nr:YkgJ family cysteine cluster protein [Burkholderiaceae bacterium]